jgi:hypothetical protein
MKTREQAIARAQCAANRDNIPYMIFKRRNGQWMYGRPVWYTTAPGSIVHSGDTCKEIIQPKAQNQHLLIAGHSVGLEELKKDIAAAKLRYTYREFCFTWATVEALVEALEANRSNNNGN